MPPKPQDKLPAFDIENILEFLPHRYPFLLVDRVLEIEKGKSLVALKNVSINEEFFQGIDVPSLIEEQETYRNPLFLMGWRFQPAREIRLGIKFLF